jgi:hypothetical protein
MSTTAIIVEILIIGLFTSFWLFLLGLRVSLFDFESIKSLASQIGPWSTPLLALAAAIVYQLGLLMNSVAYKITKNVAKLELRDNAVPDKSFEYVIAFVHQNGAEDVVREISLNLTFVRLARSGIINFFLIAVVMFLFGGKLALAGIFPLLLSIVSFPIWRLKYARHYRRIATAYQVIRDNTSISDQAKSVGSLRN